jgi:hypothetical protein
MDEKKLFEVAGVQQLDYDKINRDVEHILDRVGWAQEQIKKRQGGNLSDAKRQLFLAKTKLDDLIKELNI